MKLIRRLLASSLLAAFVVPVSLNSAVVAADTPKEKAPDVIKPVPPVPTKDLPAIDRTELQIGAGKLGRAIEELQTVLAGKPELLAYLPDIQIYHNAIRYPLKYREQIDLKPAQKAIADGLERAAALKEGKAPWALTSGPRGYVSRIDGSVQPYILGVPSEYKAGDGKRYRLDVNCHGRNENLTELVFISQKAPALTDKFGVNLYGRYCNANKFAGEVDCLEAMEAIERQYPIDENRVLMIGFSMGGAACWQFATHYTDRWAAASPGAGFAESARFLKVYANEAVAPPWYQKSLWHLYDCTDYAANLANLPTVAYAGELDTQKQASDVMMEAMAAEGLKLERIIGPNTKHAYEKNAKVQLDKRLDELLAKGRNAWPEKLHFTTWTLRYNRMFWLTVDGLEHHWRRARVEAEMGKEGYTLKTENVSALTIAVPAGSSGAPAAFSIDGEKVTGTAEGMPPKARFVRRNGKWAAASEPAGDGLAKRHGLQGPIDDAFMEHFLIVRPTGNALHENVGRWAAAECEHAIDHWRKQFRGEALVKNDTDVTDADMAAGNVILFGDPGSNRLIARITEKLPIHWNLHTIDVGDAHYSADDHAPILIYPNPLSPNHYVVLNSGFTFREYDYLNNARQVPKLPDYAVIDISTPPNAHGPGEVVDAGFFGEHWELIPGGGH